MRARLAATRPLASVLLAILVLSATAANAMAQADDAAQQPAMVELKGRVTAVTVYRGRALVTREVEVDLPRGQLTEFVITDLPEQVLPGTLFAECEGGTVRSVRYRARAVQQVPRQDVRDLTEKIQQQEKLIRQNQASQQLLSQRSSYLDSLEKFSAERSTDEASRGTLNADALIKMTGFLFEQREAVAGASLQLQEEQRLLQERLTLLERQRTELTKSLSRTAREAVIGLEPMANARNARGPLTLRLSYAVGQASWSPSYNLRARANDENVNLQYMAQIQQMTGEDWTGVTLTLSTASPAMLADSPSLTPLWVVLSDGRNQQAAQTQGYQIPGSNAEVQRYRQQTKDQLDQTLNALPLANRPEDQYRYNERANDYGNALQLLDLVASRKALFDGPAAPSADRALSVTYTLPSPISLPSRNDQQMIQIAALELPAESYYVATPLLTPYVYQQAKVSNNSGMALLAGPMTAYLDGQFQGQGQIPLVAKGQKFYVGLGVETQLRSNRELVDKTENVQGGNQVMDVKYRLVIENFMDKAVKVQVLDRLPEPMSPDIRLSLVSQTAEISQEPLYQRTLRPKGILRWEVEVPAEAAGAEAATIEYSYRMEFDRNLTLAEPVATILQRNREEFKLMKDSLLVP